MLQEFHTCVIHWDVRVKQIYAASCLTRPSSLLSASAFYTNAQMHRDELFMTSGNAQQKSKREIIKEVFLPICPSAGPIYEWSITADCGTIYYPGLLLSVTRTHTHTQTDKITLLVYFSLFICFVSWQNPFPRPILSLSQTRWGSW